MSDVLKGAAGIAAIIPGAQPIALALGIADALGAGDWLTKHVLGDTGGAVATAVVQAAAAVTGGATDPATVRGLPADQQAALRVQLAQIAAQQADAERAAEAARQAAILADTKDARGQTVALAQVHSPIAWSPVVISAIVLGTFGAVMYAALTHTVPTGSENIVTMLLGALTTMATAVVSYWVGSSSGAASQVSALANSVPANLLTGGGQGSRPFVR